MNCKPGDLAIFIRGRDPLEEQLVGKIFKVTRIKPCGHWDYEGPRVEVRLPPIFLLFFYPIVDCLPDECLKPIRGDEGQDETLGWKELPKKELV